MPRMRDARPSGRNSSSRSIASPVPRNLIGTPVTAFTASAAPPRASPSSLVRIEAVEREPLGEAPGHVHGVAAHQRVAHQQRVRGRDRGVDRLELVHQLVVDREPAGGVVDDRVEALGLRALARRRGRSRRRRLPAIAACTGTPIERAELLRAAAPRRGGRRRRRPAAAFGLASRGSARASRRRSSCRRPGGRAASPRSCRVASLRERRIDRTHQRDRAPPRRPR